jgi:lipopolysaccharide transport system permease protein
MAGAVGNLGMSGLKLHPVMFRSLWNYRGFVFGAVKREFQMRYRGSLLGGLWAVFNPLAMIVVFTVVFSKVMNAHLPENRGGAFGFSIYLCSAMLPWNWFAELLSRLNGVFIENANLMKKASFPRICLPTITFFSSAIHFFIIFALYLVFLAVIDAWPGMPLLAFPLVMVVQVSFAIGLGLLLGTLNVFFRDIGQFTGVLLQFWMWFTPIIYMVSTLSPSMQTVASFNPITSLAEANHAIFLQHTYPQWNSLIYPSVLALFLLGFGGMVFLRLSGEIVDEL